MLHVAVIRHAIALDREIAAEQGLPDSERPLTEPGCEKMRQEAHGLTRILPDLSLLLSSPILRAKQTAEIVSEVYGGLPIVDTDALGYQFDCEAVAAAIEPHQAHGVVGIVGHEPDLSWWISWAAGGSGHSFIEMKKGAVCLLEFSDTVVAGEALLLWALRPNHLRKLGIAREPHCGS